MTNSFIEAVSGETDAKKTPNLAIAIIGAIALASIKAIYNIATADNDENRVKEVM